MIIGDPMTPGHHYRLLGPSVTITDSATPIVVADGTPLPAQTLQLPTAYLTGDGFTDTTIYSNTNISLPSGTPLVLTPGASLSLIAPHITVDSSITSIAGALLFENVQSDVLPAPTSTTASTASRQGIVIGDDVTLDVSGQWTNDSTLSAGVAPRRYWRTADPLI